MTPDEQDSRLDQLLRATKTPAPPADLADRIVAFATVQPQQPRQARLSGVFHRVFGGLVAEWPHGLAYKAAFLILVAAITFGTGIGQGVRNTTAVADDDLDTIIFGDFTNTL